ncbi:hypothetical protein O3P69_017652 [Scylla paramamosain]|uniref:Uncharacterized protein n=1 Tax=Scylla paramamosain TaxID=85552 RepID=A0AAW0U082_SCYPA
MTQRVWWWLTVAALVVAALGVPGANAQRSSNRLAQIMRTMMSGMGNVASRISKGMIKSMGGTPGQGQLREAPPPQRKRKTRPIPSTLPDDGALAPNAPRPPRTRKEKPRSRMSFRRFVDTTMAGIANFMPRLRRRSSHRHRFVRDAEVSPSSPPPSESPSMMSRWDGPDPSLPASPSSPSSSSSSPPASSSKGIHVTVNVFHGHPAGVAGGAGVPGPAPLDSLSVSHYPNHTVDLQHSYIDGGADGGPHSRPQPLSLSPHMTHSSETPFEPVSWPPLSYVNSFTPPKFPSFNDFLGSLEQEQGWQENPQDTADIPGYAPVTPGTPSNQYPAGGADEVYQINTPEGIDVGVTNDVHSHPEQNRGRPTFQIGNRINRTSYVSEGSLYPGGEGAYPAGGGSYSAGGGSYSAGGGSYSVGEGSYSAGVGYVGEGQQGSSQVSQVVGAGQGVQTGSNAGCGMRCLWNDLMRYLDHYSSTKDKEASLRAPLTQTHPHHRPHRPPQQQGKAHRHLTNTPTPLATNINRRQPTLRQRPHPHPPRKTAVVRDKSKPNTPPLLRPRASLLLPPRQFL